MFGPKRGYTMASDMSGQMQAGPLCSFDMQRKEVPAMFPFRDTLQRPTSWHILTSSGESASVGSIVSVGVTHANIYVTQTPETATLVPTPGGYSCRNVTRLRFFGAGAGVGIGPLLVDLSASEEQMPSGGRIYCGPSLEGTDVSLSDLSGWCTMETYAVGALVARGWTVLYFGVGPSRFLPNAVAVGVIEGVQVGVPGISAMEYVGRISQ